LNGFWRNLSWYRRMTCALVCLGAGVEYQGAQPKG
jgi:hypothetical protein